MPERLLLGQTEIEVVFKDIQNVHLSVYPPKGKVRISAPQAMSLDTLRVYAISKLGWIRKEQRKMQAQLRETPRDFSQRESHYLWGRRYLLKVTESDSPARMEVKPRSLHLHLRPGTTPQSRNEIVALWYREQVREAAQNLFAQWEPRLGVKVTKLFVQHMKTRWGSCNPDSGSIRLNTELAKKPRECLEYIVVHELTHLREPNHGDRFTAILDQVMPNWRQRKALLNRLPVRHEEWGY
ncbi:MAG: M48 family metallopeptidase [Fibrobacteres bacterium]|nr:M48 family metallopeptidase [Fibrobacterota bacterium]